MHTATVAHLGAGGFRVVSSAEESTTTVPAPGNIAEVAVPEKSGPSPIAPEKYELIWALGAFVVFGLLMRLFLFPRLKKGMNARYGKIRSDHETAESTRAAAESEVAEYQSALASVKAEAAGRIDVARQALETERTARIAEANARIAVRKAAAVAETDAAMAAARQSIEAAVGSVAERATELTLGKRPDPATVQRAVAEAMRSGVNS